MPARAIGALRDEHVESELPGLLDVRLDRLQILDGLLVQRALRRVRRDHDRAHELFRFLFHVLAALGGLAREYFWGRG